MTIPRRRGLLALGIVICLAAAAALTGYRAAYGTFAWWRGPARITWCDRTYLPGTSGLTRAQVTAAAAALPGDTPYPVVTVMRVPAVIGWPVLASVVPDDRRRTLNVPCAMALYVQTWSGRYTAYAISGGP